MAAPVLVVKAVATGLKNWKVIVPILLGIILLLVFFPVFVLNSFLPSAKEEMYAEYQRSASSAGLDWIELVVYDTVRLDNDFSKAISKRTPFDFIKLSYTIREKEEKTGIETRVVNGVTEYHISFHNGNTAWVTSSALSAIPSGSYSYISTTIITWKVVDSGSAQSYSPIMAALSKLGYGSSDANISDVISFVDSLQGSEQYQATIDKYTLLDLVDRFDDNHKGWAFDLYTALIDENGAFGSVRDFYNSDGLYMANIVLDADAYELGDVSVLTGDTDINQVFAGRIAALSEDREKIANITSGYRSVSEQQAIWDNTPPERRGKYVAAPGHSRHQYGLAADVNGWLLYMTNYQLEKYGLYKPMPYENWHIEPVETKQSRNAA